MTKRVRIENADTSDAIVVVEVYELPADPLTGEAVKTEHIVLAYPTEQAEVTIHAQRYLVITDELIKPEPSEQATDDDDVPY